MEGRCEELNVKFLERWGLWEGEIGKWENEMEGEDGRKNGFTVS